jgi:hypothetical protein
VVAVERVGLARLAVATADREHDQEGDPHAPPYSTRRAAREIADFGISSGKCRDINVATIRVEPELRHRRYRHHDLRRLDGPVAALVDEPCYVGPENTVAAWNDGDSYTDCNDGNCCNVVACAKGTYCNP